MPTARALLRTSLPLAGLGALALQAALQSGPASTVLTSEGRGSVAPIPVGRIITDGHPQRVLLPVRRTQAAPAPRLPSVTPSRRTPHRVAPRATAPRPAAGAVALAQPVPSVRDTYPWASDATEGADTWGFTKRQCVSYVAWRLAQSGRSIENSTQHWGSALDWDDTAARLGYGVTSQPSVGAVAQWNANERSGYWSRGASSSNGSYVAGPAGHVAWVVQVYGDGSVLVAQYNGMGDRAFSTMRVTAPRFLLL
ncbi:MAG TPA: CHAP domain-containing protein [Mycobacteriales bacterium]|nr:CHAP domain-containing protein [Mycobacteriales bacterium]